jgi:hypothetical protein
VWSAQAESHRVGLSLLQYSSFSLVTHRLSWLVILQPILDKNPRKSRPEATPSLCRR